MYDNTTVQYGGTAFTLTKNTGRPLEETELIESAFKELHADMYVWGEKKLEESIKTGYIEYALGFKLHLPHYPEFKIAHEKIGKFLKSDWKLYSAGKKEFKAKEAADLLNEDYLIVNDAAYRFYKNNKGHVSKYFKLKSQYMRLCLNAPSQGTSAHQTKAAACLLFEDIETRGLIDKVLIVNIIHDEFNLETIYPLDHPITLEYTEKVGRFMREAGDQLLINNVVFMSADGKAATNWYDAK